MTSSRIAAIMSLAVSAALLGTLATAPAYGAYEISPSADTSASQQESVDFSAAPRQMPDTSALNSQIPSDATYVSPDYVTLSDGSMVDATTAQPVNDEKLVGDANKPADPLAKTDGKSFVPITVGEAKQAAGDSAAQDQAQSAPKRMQRSLPLGNGSYGAYWGTYNGTRAFFESDGTLFAQQAKSVIDVSQWQGNIDWQAAKNAGVEGAIIRLSYGWDNGFDTYARRNISECKRLGIPFGVYIYSYAQDAGDGASEGSDVASLLRQAGVSPGDLSYPVFYDLERWTWSGHTPPTSPSVYDGIVNAWYSKLNAAGYHNLSVYSYTSYLNTALNSTNIRSKTRWVASYGARTGFPYSTNDRGWQYSDSGNVNGISGSVDLNAFGNKEYRADIDVRQMTSVALPNGTYYINALLKDSSSVDIPGGGAQNEIHTQLYGYNNSAAQQFTFTRQGDGSYVIANARSGKVLDVAGAAAGNKAVVWQYDADGTAAQRWFIRDSGAGYCLQSALGNWVLDINGASSGNGTPITLYAPNGSSAQKFVLASVDGTIASNSTVKITTAANSGMAVDVSGGSGENGAKIQLYPWNNSGAQLYTMKQVGNGSYLIVNAGSGKVMDVAGGSTSNGAKIQQYQSNGTNAQHWSLVKYGSGRYALISNASGKALDIPGNRITAGAALQTYAVNGTGTQQWTVTAQKTIRAELNDMAAAHRNDLDNGTHAFASAGNSSMMLDVSGGSLASGANVQLYTSNGTGAQRWSVSHDAQGYVTLTNAKSGKALDVYGASTAAGANVQQYAANGTWAQKWIAVKESGGSLSLRSALTLDRALDVSGGAMRNGANVQTYVWNGRRRSGGW